MTPDAFVPVAITDRSGFDESVHAGAVVVVDASGEVVWSAGDPSVVVYPRSSMKPLQCSAMIDQGFSGFPTVVLTRRSGEAVDTAVGCVELAVQSVGVLDVAIDGLTSCSDDMDCPDGQRCQVDLTCG